MPLSHAGRTRGRRRTPRRAGVAAAWGRWDIEVGDQTRPVDRAATRADIVSAERARRASTAIAGRMRTSQVFCGGRSTVMSDSPAGRAAATLQRVRPHDAIPNTNGSADSAPRRWRAETRFTDLVERQTPHPPRRPPRVAWHRAQARGCEQRRCSALDCGGSCGAATAYAMLNETPICSAYATSAARGPAPTRARGDDIVDAGVMPGASIPERRRTRPSNPQCAPSDIATQPYSRTSHAS